MNESDSCAASPQSPGLSTANECCLIDAVLKGNKKEIKALLKQGYHQSVKAR